MPDDQINQDEDFLTDPLVGLCATPMHLMSDEELRQYAISIRDYRQSFQTYKAQIEKTESVKVVRTRKAAREESKPKKDEFKDFDF